MVLVHATDIAAATWLVTSQTPPDQLIRFGPAGYDAYARLRYLPDPTSPGQIETDADVSADHPLWAAQARRALDVLADFTDTPDVCYCCIWDGVAGDLLTTGERHGPLVTVPHRRYVLFRGRLQDCTEAGRGQLGGDSDPAPAFVWPADRRWCFTSDIGVHWAVIGAEHAAVEGLLGIPGLDVVRATPGENPPAYR
jgi:hypothetical protein